MIEFAVHPEFAVTADVLSRADQMAATYAGRQHRYRAMNIARTELAMAYNEGAIGAVEAAQAQGYMGDMVKVWLTADDERVCPICAPLDGVEVNINAFFTGNTNRAPLRIPPAHPQCRCAVDFVEVTANLQPTAGGGIMSSGGGSVGATDGHTEIIDVRQIDFNDEATVNREISQFVDAHANDNVENTLVITPVGNVYTLRGNEVTVNPGIINRNELAGSIVIHNHPGPNADSFSQYDFSAFFDFGLSREDVVFGQNMHSMRFTGAYISGDVAWGRYREAHRAIQTNAILSSSPIRSEQTEIMRQLSNTMEGLIFHENTR